MLSLSLGLARLFANVAEDSFPEGGGSQKKPRSGPVLVGKEYDEQPGDNFNRKPLKAGYDSHRVQANAAGCAAMVIVADPDQARLRFANPEVSAPVVRTHTQGGG